MIHPGAVPALNSSALMAMSGGFDFSHRSIVLMDLPRSVAHSVLVNLALIRSVLKSHSDGLVSILIPQLIPCSGVSVSFLLLIVDLT